MEQKRIEWIDIAKGIGLLCVIIGHLHTPYITTWIYTFHMPLFFFLSGFVFSGHKYTYKEFLVKKIRTLAVPYFSLSIVIWLFYIIFNQITRTAQYGSNSDMLIEIFIQKHFWTTWFLACLFLVENIYFWMRRYVRKLKWCTLISVLICIIGLLRYRLGGDALPWNLDIAFIAQIFYHVGYIFRCTDRETNNKEKDGIIKFLIACMINVFAGYLGIKISGEALDMSVGLYGLEPLTLLSALAGIYIVVFVSKRIKSSGLTYLGQNTMIIFAVHSRIMIVLLDYIYGRIGLFQGKGVIQNIIYALLSLILILGVLIPINELLKKTKVAWIFGVQNDKGVNKT